VVENNTNNDKQGSVSTGAKLAEGKLVDSSPAKKAQGRMSHLKSARLREQERKKKKDEEEKKKAQEEEARAGKEIVEAKKRKKKDTGGNGAAVWVNMP
jgi:hypothetical protein